MLFVLFLCVCELASFLDTRPLCTCLKNAWEGHYVSWRPVVVGVVHLSLRCGIR